MYVPANSPPGIPGREGSVCTTFLPRFWILSTRMAWYIGNWLSTYIRNEKELKHEHNTFLMHFFFAALGLKN